MRLLRLIAALAVGAVVVMAMASGAQAALSVPYGRSALLAAVVGEEFTPTSVSGVNDGCRPTTQHPYPVVLVHGTTADEGSNWVTLGPLLADHGYCVYALNYGVTPLSFGDRIDGLGEIAASAHQLAGFVNRVLTRTHATKVDIVGHSQGGMMPGYYLRFLGGTAKVHTLIGLSPSNHGTTLSGLVTLLNRVPYAAFFGNLLGDLGAPALTEQEQGSAFQRRLFANGDTVRGPRYVVIQTTHDEVVTPYRNAFLHGANAANITVQQQCPRDPTGHIGMFEDSPALQNVLNQLSAHPAANFRASCSHYGAAF